MATAQAILAQARTVAPPVLHLLSPWARNGIILIFPGRSSATP